MIITWKIRSHLTSKMDPNGQHSMQTFCKEYRKKSAQWLMNSVQRRTGGLSHAGGLFRTPLHFPGYIFNNFGYFAWPIIEWRICHSVSKTGQMKRALEFWRKKILDFYKNSKSQNTGFLRNVLSKYWTSTKNLVEVQYLNQKKNHRSPVFWDLQFL